MKQSVLFVAVVSAVLAFSACKKNDPAPNNPVTEKRLKRVTKTEAGVATIYNLTYNASGKLVSFNSASNAETLKFTYDAAGNLTGIEEKDNDFLNMYVYTYQNNIPVTGIFESWDISGGLPGTLIEDDQLTYTVTNNQVSRIKLTAPGNPDFIFNLSYTNGNLTRVTTEGAIVYTADFTYGNKKSTYPRVTGYVLDQAGFSLLFAAKNEILKTVFDFPGTANDHTVNTAYTYDSNGYVLTSNDGITQQVFEYE